METEAHVDSMSELNFIKTMSNASEAQRESIKADMALLDGEGALTVEVERALETIFRKYASGATADLKTLSIKPDGLTAFAMETNGQKLPDEQVGRVV